MCLHWIAKRCLYYYFCKPSVCTGAAHVMKIIHHKDPALAVSNTTVNHDVTHDNTYTVAMMLWMYRILFRCLNVMEKYYYCANEWRVAKTPHSPWDTPQKTLCTFSQYLPCVWTAWAYPGGTGQKAGKRSAKTLAQIPIIRGHIKVSSLLDMHLAWHSR